MADESRETTPHTAASPRDEPANPAPVERITDERVIPVVTEELEIAAHRVERARVHIHKRVETRDEVVDVTTITDEVVVERVPVNQIVEGAPPGIREEGDVLIIPVLEEVVVVQQRLMLRELVHVTRRRLSTSRPQTVSLRREVVVVERIAGDGAAHTETND